MRVRVIKESIVKEKSQSFKKTDDGFYQRVERVTIRDLTANKAISVEETPDQSKYQISTKEAGYDFKMKYEEPDGQEACIYFKRVEQESSE